MAGFDYNSMSLNDNRSELIESLTAETEKIAQVSKEVVSTIEAFSKKFEMFLEESSQSIKAVQQSDDIIKYIQNISLQIKLLGFNASIEAKAMGAKGAGFNAIAQEMRRLSDESSVQAENIEEKIKVIRDTTLSTSNKLTDSHQLINNSLNSVNELEKVVSSIENLINDLKNA